MLGFHDKKIGYGANLGEGHAGVQSGKLPMPGQSGRPAIADMGGGFPDE